MPDGIHEGILPDHMCRRNDADKDMLPSGVCWNRFRRKNHYRLLRFAATRREKIAVGQYQGPAALFRAMGPAPEPLVGASCLRASRGYAPSGILFPLQLGHGNQDMASVVLRRRVSQAHGQVPRPIAGESLRKGG